MYHIHYILYISNILCITIYICHTYANEVCILNIINTMYNIQTVLHALCITYMYYTVFTIDIVHVECTYVHKYVCTKY